MLPVKCNQHPWMKMYINVVKNPFFAVTDKSGKYEIKGLPPGDYTIAFVHEKLGEQDQKVTVAAKTLRPSTRRSKPGGCEQSRVRARRGLVKTYFEIGGCTTLCNPPVL